MKPQKPSTDAERSTGTTVDTIVFTRSEAESWPVPFFQRAVVVNDKVKSLAAAIAADGGVLPGILTFGVVARERYLLDGQQRRQAFFLSEKEEGFADARFCYFSGPTAMADMAQEFVRLNSHLVAMKPDDILRGLEPALPALAYIREKCPFVGYGNIRRNDRSAALSMSCVVRAWRMATSDTPSQGGAGSSQNIASSMTMQDAEQLVAFLELAHTAWGTDLEYARLWGTLNLTLCMWLYRRLVLTRHSYKTVFLDDPAFGRCLMSLSASAVYLDWLLGRKVGERDRAPAYGRIKALFSERILHDTGKKPMLPSPAWSHGKNAS